MGNVFADHLIDGNFSSYLKAQQAANGQRVIIDLGEIMTIKGDSLHRPYNLSSGVVKDFQVYGRHQLFLLG